MSGVRFTHQIGDLADDLAKIATTTKPKLALAVKKNVSEGTRTAQAFARESSGPHGKNAWKRLTGEVLSPLSGEIGWTGDAENIVGAGWRNGGPNQDLPRAADVFGPRLANDVGAILDRAFWP